MKQAIATISADDDEGSITVDYVPDFYDRHVQEQASIHAAVLEIATHDLIGVHEEITDSLGADLEAALSVTPSSIVINMQGASA
jgi:hypothetical protein